MNENSIQRSAQRSQIIEILRQFTYILGHNTNAVNVMQFFAFLPSEKMEIHIQIHNPQTIYTLLTK